MCKTPKFFLPSGRKDCKSRHTRVRDAKTPWNLVLSVSSSYEYCSSWRRAPNAVIFCTMSQCSLQQLFNRAQYRRSGRRVQNFHSSVVMAHPWEVNQFFPGALMSPRMLASSLFPILSPPILSKSLLYFLNESSLFIFQRKTNWSISLNNQRSWQRKQGPFCCKTSRV